jgi:hypothetical protein
MPRDRLFRPQPCKAHRCVMPSMAPDVDAAIAASLRAAENEGWPPLRPVDAAPARLHCPDTTTVRRLLH